MTLLAPPIYQTLNGWSFTQEFSRHEQAYLGLAHQVAKVVLDTLHQANISIPLNPLEDFADKYLVDKVTFGLLSSSFPYFLQTLRRGTRQYINPGDYGFWGEMMARYVLQEAISRGVFP